MWELEKVLNKEIDVLTLYPIENLEFEINKIKKEYNPQKTILHLYDPTLFNDLIKLKVNFVYSNGSRKWTDPSFIDSRYLIAPYGIVYFSEMKQRILSVSNKSNNLFVIPRTLDQNLFKKKSNVNPKLQFLSIARHTKGKGISLVSKVMSEYPSIDYLIIGPPGNDTKNISNAENIHILGELPPETIYELMPKSDLLIHLSKEDGMSGVIMEALFSGLPILTTKKCLIPFITNNNVIVSDRNKPSLRYELNQIIDKKYDLLQMGKNSRKIAESHYDSKIVAKKLLDCYSQIISGDNYHLFKPKYPNNKWNAYVNTKFFNFKHVREKISHFLN